VTSFEPPAPGTAYPSEMLLDEWDDESGEHGGQHGVDDGDEVGEEEEEGKRAHSSTRSMIEWVLVVTGALAVALVIRTFFLAAFFIPSESMVATLEKGDRVLVNKLSYKLHDVHRGDIVVFKRPPGEKDPQVKDLIKRVIGLPGEVVEGKDGHVIINGEELQEPYLQPGVTTTTFGPETVPAGMVWVMGDNRSNSFDSRQFHSISQNLIVGRAFVRVWPLSRLGWL
jgi:signal peptidase I